MRSNTGLVKDVKFTKRAIKYLAESTLFEQNKSSNRATTKLWNVFDVEVEMVGNNLFRPGQMFYIGTSQTGLGDSKDPLSTASLMGIGGYYLVTTVSNQLVEGGGGKWTTTVSAIWQSNGT